MNESFRKKRTALIIIAIAGLILFCLGAIMGGSLSSIPTMFQTEQLPEGAQAVADVDISDIHGLELNLRSSDITFTTGKVFDVSGTGLINSYVKDGILHAGANEQKASTKVLGINLAVPTKWLCGYGSYVVTLPQDITLDSININTTNSTITGDTLNAATIQIDMHTFLSTHNGNFTMNNIVSNNIDCTINGGKITIPALQIAESANLSSTGKISLGNTASTGNTINNLTAKSSMHSITANTMLAGTCDLQSKRGGIHLTLTGNPGCYTIMPEKGNLETGNSTNVDSATQHLADIKVSASFGKTVVNYQ